MLNQGNTSTLQPPHSPDGAYAYIDASDSNEGSKAVLSSEAKYLNTYGKGFRKMKYKNCLVLSDIPYLKCVNGPMPPLYG